MNFYWAFFLIPAADFVVGVDTFNKRDEEYRRLRDRLVGVGRFFFLLLSTTRP